VSPLARCPVFEARDAIPSMGFPGQLHGAGVVATDWGGTWIPSPSIDRLYGSHSVAAQMAASRAAYLPFRAMSGG
jgi:hypothetical protein